MSQSPDPSRFTFVPLTLDHLPMLQDWVRRPHVAAWWDDDTGMEALVEYYGPSIAGEVASRQFIAHLDGAPLGFIQRYQAAAFHHEGWWLDEHDPGVHGIDQFLADASRLSQGLGSAMIRVFTDGIFADPDVTRIQTDPSPDNARAIRCYEKAGFRKHAVIDTMDGPALLLYLERRRAQP